MDFCDIFWVCVILIFELLLPTVDLALWITRVNLHQNEFARYQNIVLASFTTDGRTNRQTGSEHNSFTCQSGLAEKHCSAIICDILPGKVWMFCTSGTNTMDKLH